MAKGLRISAKNLSAVLLPDFCPRCFWIKNNLKAPYQIFPGIFSSIDSYTKKMVHAIFDQTGSAPVWMPEIKKATGYIKTLHWTKFQRFDKKTGIVVSGMEDDIFSYKDGSRTIVDYKTAKYTKNQDKLLPLYDGQLNLYAYVEEGFGNEVREDLPLIYCEPLTDPDPINFTQTGFKMPFGAKTLIVKKDPALVREILDKVASFIFGLIPDKKQDCPDCKKLEVIMASCAGKIFMPSGKG